jgi:hypothetical protein
MTRYAVINAKGECQVNLPGRVEANGTIRFNSGGKWMPLVLRTVCQRLGIDPQKVQRDAAPPEALAHLGDNEGNVRVLDASEWDKEQAIATAKRRATRDAELEAAIPGVTEMLKLSEQAYNEAHRSQRDFNRMMEDEYNDGARMPQRENRSFAERLSTLRASNPRADLYLKAKVQADGCSWADNTGSGAAGKKAMDILLSGGTVEDAKTALAERRDFVD